MAHYHQERVLLPSQAGPLAKPCDTQRSTNNFLLFSACDPTAQDLTINAIQVTWPTTTKRGYYFHHEQALLRNLATHNIVPEYRVENLLVREFAQVMGSIVFVQCTSFGDVRDTWPELKLILPAEMEPCLQIATSGHGLGQILLLPSSPHGFRISTILNLTS